MTSTNKKGKKADNFLWLRGDSLELYAVIQFKQYFEKKKKQQHIMLQTSIYFKLHNDYSLKNTTGFYGN